MVMEEIKDKSIREAVEAMPKLPYEKNLIKTLPRALSLLSKNKYSVTDGNRCHSELSNLIKLLLINNYDDSKFVTESKDERERIKNFLLIAHKKKIHKMIEEYHDAISKILKYNIFWIRDIETWEWKSRNTYKQFKSLVSHLFCKYDVPEFMFQSWESKSSYGQEHIEWFLHLADGKSARDISRFPFLMTRKMAFEFINTPFPGYSIEDSVRRCQVIGLGGDDRLANAVLMSRLRNQFKNNDFWTSVIQFFVGVPMLNLDEVGTIIDYINEKKFVSKHFVKNGIRIYAPENPNLTIKGKNITNLIQETHNWHKELKKHSKADMSAHWKGTGIESFIHEEGNKEKNSHKIYEIAELLTAKDLHREGKTMHHCVFSYMSSCIKGTCAIFSLQLFGQSLVTIEVRDNQAVQIRGPYNKPPEQKERTIIYNWASKNNIEITKYAIRN